MLSLVVCFFQDEAVDEKASALLSADILTGLVSANWKERLAAMESFTSVRGCIQ